MRITRLAVSGLGAGLAAATLAVATCLPSEAATSTGWQLVFRAHYGTPTIYNGIVGVAALAKTSAWAVGGDDLSGGTPGTPIAEQWNGSSWRPATLPSGLTGTLGAVSAPTGSDVWAVSQLTGYVLHWDGTTWSVARKWKESQSFRRQLTGVTAFSPTNVWVFGAPGANPGLGTWHLSGTTWTKVTGLGGGVSTASALSAADMWAIGSDATAPDDILVRYNGTTWQRVSSPALEGQQFSGILATSDSDVWVTATVGGRLPWHLLHFDGHGWTSASVPSSLQLRAITSDGHGGLWFSAARSSSQAPFAVHRSAAGTWSSHPLPTGTGQAFGIALIPGTASLWSAGFLQTAAGTGSDAVVWGHGPGT